MFSDEVRGKIINSKELDFLDLRALSIVMHTIETILEEEAEDDKQSVSGYTYDE